MKVHLEGPSGQLLCLVWLQVKGIYAILILLILVYHPPLSLLKVELLLATTSPAPCQYLGGCCMCREFDVMSMPILVNLPIPVRHSQWKVI